MIIIIIIYNITKSMPVSIFQSNSIQFTYWLSSPVQITATAQRRTFQETPINYLHYICLFSCRYNPLWLYFHSPVAGFSLFVFEDAPQSVGLLWTSDQSVAETSTWQHTTLTTDKHPSPGWDSNPQSQQASGRRPTPETARPLGPTALRMNNTWNIK